MYVCMYYVPLQLCRSTLWSNTRPLMRWVGVKLCPDFTTLTITTVTNSPNFPNLAQTFAECNAWSDAPADGPPPHLVAFAVRPHGQCMSLLCRIPFKCSLNLCILGCGLRYSTRHAPYVLDPHVILVQLHPLPLFHYKVWICMYVCKWLCSPSSAACQEHRQENNKETIEFVNVRVRVHTGNSTAYMIEKTDSDYNAPAKIDIRCMYVDVLFRLISAVCRKKQTEHECSTKWVCTSTFAAQQQHGNGSQSRNLRSLR